jgi:hypothetical protein
VFAAWEPRFASCAGNNEEKRLILKNARLAIVQRRLSLLKPGERQMKSWIQRCSRSSTLCSKSKLEVDRNPDLVASATSS